MFERGEKMKSKDNIRSDNTKLITKKITYEVRGEPIEIEETIRINKKTGEEIFDEEIENKNLDVLYNKYRSKYSLLLPEEITEIRGMYGLSQRAFSRILGWGEITTHRYETGALQDQSHNDTLVLLKNPENMKILVERNKDKINQRDYKKIMEQLGSILVNNADNALEENIIKKYTNEVLDEYCGYTQFNYEKLVNMVLYFALNVKKLYKTKLMKFLFYSDFVNFRNNTVSITGLKYLKNYYGPTPVRHDLLLGILSDKFITFEVDFIVNFEEFIYIEPMEQPCLSIFSKEELETIKYVLNRFKNLSSKEISELSHKEKAWKISKTKELISYELAKDLKCA
jgi:putative zinc finger/helix-turn-helix YgiT family protein